MEKIYIHHYAAKLIERTDLQNIPCMGCFVYENGKLNFHKVSAYDSNCIIPEHLQTRQLTEPSRYRVNFCQKCIDNPARNPCIKPSEPNDIDFQCHWVKPDDPSKGITGIKRTKAGKSQLFKNTGKDRKNLKHNRKNSYNKNHKKMPSITTNLI